MKNKQQEQEQLKQFVTDLEIMLNSRYDYNDYQDQNPVYDAGNELLNAWLENAEDLIIDEALAAEIEFSYIDGEAYDETVEWLYLFDREFFIISLDYSKARWTVSQKHELNHPRQTITTK